MVDGKTPLAWNRWAAAATRIRSRWSGGAALNGIRRRPAILSPWTAAARGMF